MFIFIPEQNTVSLRCLVMLVFFQGSPGLYHSEDFVKAKTPYLVRLMKMP